MAILYIVATPIGNLRDFSLRALETLKEVDLILSEDTRVTRKLLDYYKISTPILSYHQHSKLNKVNYILELLRKGKNLALVSDAGTPGISDPGNKLVAQIVNSLPGKVRIIPLPGASALTSAVSVSGFAMDRLLFLGFAPSKRKRRKFFEEIINSKYPVIFYESPHRIIKTLEELKNFLTTRYSKQNAQYTGRSARYELKTPQIMVCRELTKKFETIYRGKIAEIIEEIKKDKIRGEFVIVVDRK